MATSVREDGLAWRLSTVGLEALLDAGGRSGFGSSVVRSTCSLLIASWQWRFHVWLVGPGLPTCLGSGVGSMKSARLSQRNLMAACSE